MTDENNVKRNSDSSIRVNITNIIKGLVISGHAKEGTGHFVRQRLTAIILIPLIFFLICALATLAKAHNFADVHATISNPILFIGLLLFVIIGFYHGVLGIQVIIDDYISCQKTNNNIMLLVKILAVVFALLFIISIFKIAF